ncbi:hypothetical protein [Lentzea sp. NEAU-D7]|uniref:baeRF3 domain-containing protein n=1 Tax=Lentzea sp. NEAU-D7 TaxID=2994667 RepID=UPI00224AFB19|nr:hypothetical protein [Lentzea sp. NEAU-D7]MCX2951399.1 hypothetical protein [Lentzea sp. NEAU-D7]
MASTPLAHHPDDSTAAQRRPGAPDSARTTPLTTHAVTALQAVRAYPSISLLACTRPGAVMHPGDVATLRTLAAQARNRLDAEHVPNARPLLDALDTMIREAAGRPADRAVALFVSAAHSRRVDLPVPVVDRCVIDPTFATRDLVRALQHTPRHTVLLLSADHARLLHGHGTVLVPAPGSAFPARRRSDGDHTGRGAERPIEFLRRVDRVLGAALRLYPMPLVLVAAEPTSGNFRRLSRNTARLAGTVKGNHLATPTETLVDLIRPVLRDYLRSRAQQALDLIEQRAAEGRVLTDIGTAWLAARWERPEMLAVEEDYFYPARLNADGDTLTPADDVDHPEVIDDAVDELIETVLSRGGWIALLPPGELPGGARLALTLRRR